MKQTKKQSLTFFQKIHKYRVKIGLITFLVAIPLALLLAAFLGPYTSNKNVYFDEEKTDVQSKFVDLDELEELTLQIEWTTLVNPRFDEEGTVTTHGAYRFDISYEPKGAYNLTSVVITPVLHTDWFPHNEIGSKTQITQTKKSVSIPFDETFPMRRLLFVEINEPNLYLKVEYTYTLIDQTVTKTAYVKYTLKGLNPPHVS